MTKWPRVSVGVVALSVLSLACAGSAGRHNPGGNTGGDDGENTGGSSSTGGKSGGTGGKASGTGGSTGGSTGSTGGSTGSTGGSTGSTGGSGPPPTGHLFGAHSGTYPMGSIRPTGSQDSLDAAVKAAYVTSGCGGTVVKSTGEPNQVTSAPALGLGMIITAMMAGADADAQKLF